MKYNQFHMQIITNLSFSHVQCSVQKQNRTHAKTRNFIVIKKQYC